MVIDVDFAYYDILLPNNPAHSVLVSKVVFLAQSSINTLNYPQGLNFKPELIPRSSLFLNSCVVPDSFVGVSLFELTFGYYEPLIMIIYERMMRSWWVDEEFSVLSYPLNVPVSFKVRRLAFHIKHMTW